MPSFNLAETRGLARATHIDLSGCHSAHISHQWPPEDLRSLSIDMPGRTSSSLFFRIIDGGALGQMSGLEAL